MALAACKQTEVATTPAAAPRNESYRPIDTSVSFGSFPSSYFEASSFMKMPSSALAYAPADEPVGPQLASVTSMPVPDPPHTRPIGPRSTSYGIASFYRHDSRTASGERFDARELTAAHRTLPFGTRLRVTSVKTGKSVTVRVNDRGPYVPGRIVDLSYSAADSIGMVGRGVTKVKVEVVEQ
jgi:rare lipoprotein A